VEWPAAPASDAVEQLLAAIDDDGPTAVQEDQAGVTVFFADSVQRDRAMTTVRASTPGCVVTALSVSDDAWAERSQASLTAVRIGRVVVAPPWAVPAPGAGDITITIVPSMGFGTGHHASTRLCLGLLQDVVVSGRRVLDVGTGSGVLAIAAWKEGAREIVAIDVDADALVSARENVGLNGATSAIELKVADVAHEAGLPGDRFDVILANLTGAMLQRFADALASRAAPGADLIISGFQVDEERAVEAAFTIAGAIPHQRQEEDTWVALHLRT
jgi:ribosomal protein L11 methyltransferase